MLLFGSMFGSMNFVTIAFSIMEKIQKQKPPKTVIRKNTKFFQSECTRARRNRRGIVALFVTGRAMIAKLTPEKLRTADASLFVVFGSKNWLHDRVVIFCRVLSKKTKWAWRHLALFLRTNRNPSDKNNKIGLLSKNIWKKVLDI